MDSTLVMILAGGRGERLYPLTRDRAKPSVPFGGIYRIIDFTLSNCLNSGLRRIYLLTQYRSISLVRHLAQGWQSLFRGELDEFVQPVAPQERFGQMWYRGTADAVYQNIYTLQEHRPERVLILSGDHVYKMNYLQMLRFHAEKDAEITIACIAYPLDEASRFGVMEVDENWRVVGFDEKPKEPKPMPQRSDMALCSMGIYVFNTDILIKSVVEDSKRAETTHDFGRDVIPAQVGRRRLLAYDFAQQARPEQPAYWRDIGTIDAYYAANMELLQFQPQFNLYDASWPIRTLQLNLPPAKILAASPTQPAQVQNSLVSAGCVVTGAKVVHSILSPSVRVEPGAVVEDSIIFNDVVVGRNAYIKRAIIDKRVVVPDGYRISADDEATRRQFYVSPEGVVVIPRAMHLA
ncbi:MAG: glucose-1-phosphate adenylyltransferase [Planctomycetota bacterium]|nr:MAG: glucose-1-phosphate adenylyltransferase [Planctomycetota bacterium]